MFYFLRILSSFDKVKIISFLFSYNLVLHIWTLFAPLIQWLLLFFSLQRIFLLFRFWIHLLVLGIFFASLHKNCSFMWCSFCASSFSELNSQIQGLHLPLSLPVHHLSSSSLEPPGNNLKCTLIFTSFFLRVMREIFEFPNVALCKSAPSCVVVSVLAALQRWIIMVQCLIWQHWRISKKMFQCRLL